MQGRRNCPTRRTQAGYLYVGARGRALLGSDEPALDLPFIGGGIDSRLTASGGSGEWVFNSAGVLVPVTSPPVVYDPTTLQCKGLLGKPARTNGIQNNTMQGGVAPSTLPTLWFDQFTNQGTLAATYAYGSENGIPYIELNLSGTPAAAGTYTLLLASSAPATATVGQTWTVSAYTKLQAGSLTNLTTRLGINERAAGFLGSLNGSNFVVGSGAIGVQRPESAMTTINASTTNVVSRIDLVYAAAVATAVTIRIGLPQLELGSFATPAIPTTSAAVTVTAHSVTLEGANFAQIYNPVESTWVVDFETIALGVASEVYWGISATGDFDNCVYLSGTSGGNLVLTVRVGAVSVASLNLGAVAAATRYKVALSLRTNEIAARVNGGAELLDTAAALPTCALMGVERAPWGNFSHPYACMRCIQGHKRSMRGSLLRLSTQ